MIEIPKSYKGLRKDTIALYASLGRWRHNYKRYCNARAYKEVGRLTYLDGIVIRLGQGFCACCRYDNKHGMCPIKNMSCKYTSFGCFKEYVHFCDITTDNATIIEVRKAVKAICKRIEKAITQNLKSNIQRKDNQNGISTKRKHSGSCKSAM